VIFISHSSRDHAFAKQLAADVEKAGLPAWLDEWQIRVGDCIISTIDHALTECRFLVVVLSPRAVASGWVSKEWKAKYWDEVNDGRVRVLPVLFEACDVPALLKTKRYADMSTDYSGGLKVLIDSLKAFITEDSSRDFYAYAPVVVSSLISDENALRRNQWWDTFEQYVAGLSPDDRLKAQAGNTIAYLEQWGLSIEQLRTELGALGFLTPPNAAFTPDLAVALERFQFRNNLRHTDGVFGELTYQKMYELHEQKLRSKRQDGSNS
jgi:hypothetical protein